MMADIEVTEATFHSAVLAYFSDYYAKEAKVGPTSVYVQNVINALSILVENEFPAAKQKKCFVEINVGRSGLTIRNKCD